MNIQISNGFYNSKSNALSTQECTNLYPNIPQVEGALNTGNLFGTPGLTQKLTTGNKSNRGYHIMNGIPYFVNGEILYKINRSVVVGVETFTAETIGTIAGSGRVSSSDNGSQLMIIAEGDGYIYDETTFSKINDPDFKASGTPEHVVFIDSYFLVATSNKKIIRSDPNNGLSWNALLFGSAERDPDPVQSLFVYQNEVYVGGSETMEVLANTGGSGFNFTRTGFFVEKGVSAPYSMVRAFNGFMFVGAGENERPAIWSISGNGINKISNTAIDNVLSNMSKEEIRAAYANSYAEAGAYFVVFSFNSRTFVYDTISNKWHERKSRIGNTLSAWRVSSIAMAYDTMLVADTIDGRIGEMSLDTYDEYSTNIERTVSLPPLYNGGNSFIIDRIRILVDSGEGTGTLDPILRLSLSRDGGHTWGNEKQRNFGKLGEYEKRLVWRNQGYFSRYAQLKLETSSNVRVSINKVEADFTSGY